MAIVYQNGQTGICEQYVIFHFPLLRTYREAVENLQRGRRCLALDAVLSIPRRDAV